MDQLERQNRIVEYLRIKPISHGQVYTFQIAVPESQVLEISSSRREILRNSLTEKGSNLIPVIVRRTEAYSEEEEYEVVYGADWCIVAKEVDIEKLWVWVFDMTDEQAAAARVEMENLLNSAGTVALPPIDKWSTTTPMSSSVSSADLGIEGLMKQLEKLIEKKQESTGDTIYKQISESIGDTIHKQISESMKALGDTLIQQLLEARRDEINKPKPGRVTDTSGSKYGKHTVKELGEMLKERGIKVTSKMRKDELIAALEKADAS